MGVTSFAQHFRWQLRALGFNPLIRASDRLEALAVLSVLATAIFALPVAAQAGTMSTTRVCTPPTSKRTVVTSSRR